MLNVYYSKKDNEVDYKEMRDLPKSVQDIVEKYAPVRAFDFFGFSGDNRDNRIQCLENIFYNMQGEIWSPNGEKRDLIRSLGLAHTSMSVGDFVCDTDTNMGYMVASIGWVKFNMDNPSVKIEEW